MNRWVARHLIWPATERLLGRDTMRRLSLLQRTDRAAASQLADIQVCKLRRLLAAVHAHCPFYRERLDHAGIDPANPHLGLDALKHVPLLERSEVREHLGEMTWHDCPGGPPRPYTTGGSSGEPLQFYIDRCRQAADWSARLRARSWWGIAPGDREMMVWAGPVQRTASDVLRVLRDRLLNQHVLDAFNMSEQTLRAYVDGIRRYRPHLLYGYASSLALLARHMLQHGDALVDARHAPGVVFVTGETVAPRDAADIQSAFGAPVVIEYGSRDCGLIAGGCQAGRLHVADENVIVEVLDENGHPVAPGGAGEVVITILEAFTTPFIRYRVGDLAQVPADSGSQPDGRCACGRASHQLVEVRGRTTDQIVRPDGNGVRRMHALSLIYVLREIDGLRQFRIIQETLRQLEVEVVADERFTPAAEQSALQGLRRRMGPDVEIHITRRECIAPTASGKHACVVSKMRSTES